MKYSIISVTLHLQGAVRLLRTVKKVERKGSTYNQHDVTTQNGQCTQQFTVPIELWINNLPSQYECRKLGIYYWTKPETAFKIWNNQPVRHRIEAHLRDWKHDTGAIKASYVLQ